MEVGDRYSAAELAAVTVLETASVLAGIAISHKFKEQGAELPVVIVAGVGAALLGVKASTNVVERINRSILL